MLLLTEFNLYLFSRLETIFSTTYFNMQDKNRASEKEATATAPDRTHLWISLTFALDSYFEAQLFNFGPHD